MMNENFPSCLMFRIEYRVVRASATTLLSYQNQRDIGSMESRIKRQQLIGKYV